MFDIPVIANWYGEEVRIGTADFIDNGVKMTLSGRTIDEVQKIVEAGGEIRAFHVNIEMLAARKKEGD
jgi:hypothetical protein